MNGQLLRPRYDRKVAGVCAAFARAYGWDVTVVRIVLLALVLFGGGGVLAYVICWIVIPEESIGMPPYAGYPGAPTGYPGGPAAYTGAAYPPPPPANYSGGYPPPPGPNEPPTA